MSSKPTISFWEKEVFLKNIDLIIIGSGIVGLTAAIEFNRLHPAKKIVILERGSFPSGASTKNAGFACFGSLTELASDMEVIGDQKVFDLVDRRWRGLSVLKELVGTKSIEYENLGGYELFTNRDQNSYDSALNLMPKVNAELQKIIGKDTFQKADDRISLFKFKGIEHIIFNQYEAQINTGKMISQMIALARESGIEIINGITVNHIEDVNTSVEIETTLGKIKCQQCLIATNGFTKKLLPEIEVEPARAQVLITSPIPNLPFKGTFHYNEGYYYFRNVGDRVLFGGGRNLDLARETTTEMALSNLIQEKLEELLTQVILPSNSFEIEQRWSGIMGVSKSKETISRQLSENVSCAVRLGGMGIAIGSLIGQDAARSIKY